MQSNKSLSDFRLNALFKLINKMSTFFLINISKLKKMENQIVENKELVIIQDRKNPYIRLGFFNYYRVISSYLLSNIYTKLEIVNRT